jgi:radical SAM protein with 4Fe4S-binding SPASM domain
LRLHFPRDLVIDEDGDQTWVLCPSVDKWFRANEAAVRAVRLIMREGGNVSLGMLAASAQPGDEGRALHREASELIEALIGTGVFFLSAEEMNSAIRVARGTYAIPEGQPLRMVYLHPTHRCNLRCWYCYNSKLEQSSIEELQTEELMKLLDRLMDGGARHFVITGGEPLLRPDIYDVIASVRRSNTYFELLTNGTLFDKCTFEKLNTVIDRFIVSVDSLRGSTEYKSPRGEGFENVLKMLGFFSNHAPHKLTVRSVVTRTNVREIEATREILRTRYGLNRYIATVFLPNSKQEIAHMPGLPGPSALVDSWVFQHEHPRRKYRCGAGTSVIAVDCRGDVYPCQNFLGERWLRTSNVLRDVDWHRKHLTSDTRELFRRLSVDTLEICRTCGYRYLCGGGCRAVSLKVYGRLDGHLGFMCEHLKAVARRRLMSARLRPVSREGQE